MDYLCVKFDKFSVRRFGFIVRKITESQTELYTEADDRYTHVSNEGMRSSVQGTNNRSL